MNYLIQERNESCVKYRNINENPIQHYQHLFFTNGNGVDFINGNPVQLVEFWRVIPWADYYKNTTTFEYIKEYFIEYTLPNQIEEQVAQFQTSYSELYDDEVKKLNELQEITTHQMTDYVFWLNCLMDTDSYFPYLSLSDGYFKLQKINENTEKTLVKVAIAVTKAYVIFYQDIVDSKYKIKSYKSILSYKWDDNSINQCYNTSIDSLAKLKIELIKLEKLK